MKAPDSKSGVVARQPWVRIPPCPPSKPQFSMVGIRAFPREGESKLGLVEDFVRRVDDVEKGMGGGVFQSVEERRCKVKSGGELFLIGWGEEALDDGNESFFRVWVVFRNGDGVETGEGAFFWKGDMPCGKVNRAEEDVR